MGIYRHMAAIGVMVFIMYIVAVIFPKMDSISAKPGEHVIIIIVMFALVIGLFRASFLISESGHQLRVPSFTDPEQLLDLSKRFGLRPILYLRGFEEDARRQIDVGGGFDDPEFSEEELSAIIGEFGFGIAVAGPGLKPPPLGFARIILDESNWLHHVKLLADNSCAIIVSANSFLGSIYPTGIGQEVDMVADLNYLSRTLFIAHNPAIKMRLMDHLNIPYDQKTLFSINNGSILTISEKNATYISGGYKKSIEAALRKIGLTELARGNKIEMNKIFYRWEQYLIFLFVASCLWGLSGLPLFLYLEHIGITGGLGLSGNLVKILASVPLFFIISFPVIRSRLFSLAF